MDLTIKWHEHQSNMRDQQLAQAAAELKIRQTVFQMQQKAWAFRMLRKKLARVARTEKVHVRRVGRIYDRVKEVYRTLYRNGSLSEATYSVNWLAELYLLPPPDMTYEDVTSFMAELLPRIVSDRNAVQEALNAQEAGIYSTWSPQSLING